MNDCHRSKKPGYLWIALGGLALVLILLLLLQPAIAFIGLFSTEAQTAAVGANITFSALGPAENITFTAPDTATLGAAAGGTYLVSYDLTLDNTGTEEGVVNTFAVAVNGVLQPSTAAGITLDAGAVGRVDMTSIIAIPSGALVTLVNVGPDGAQLTAALGGVGVVSADLNLVRLGA